MRLMFLFALLPLACAHAVSRDTANQINADRRLPHASDGQIVFGPTTIDQRVVGQRDAAGNIHVTTDRYFLSRSDQLSRAQIALAQLAQERAASPEVRQLADREMAEHQRIHARVSELSAARRLPPDNQPASAEAYSYQQLSQLSGEQFDHAYAAEALRLDREQLQLFNEVLNSSNDRQVAQLAFDTLPALRAAHEQAAAISVRM
jgi:putative membrane protein